VLVIAGFLPQFLAFYLPHTSRLLSNEAASACLIFSQILLIGFAWVNRSLPGMPLLLAGLGCNLAVILSNGGFMPLMAEAAANLVSKDILNGIQYGARISHSSKDILLTESVIRLPWLADRFASPIFLPYHFIYSAGDVLIAIGAFFLLAKGRTSRSQA
jgi:hypothetical protein